MSTVPEEGNLQSVLRDQSLANPCNGEISESGSNYGFAGVGIYLPVDRYVDSALRSTRFVGLSSTV